MYVLAEEVPILDTIVWKTFYRLSGPAQNLLIAEGKF